jgi:ABC-2 type transport system permease protein
MIHYRWGHLASLAADPIILLINISLFTSIYFFNKTDVVLGYTLPQMIWYCAVITFVWYFIWNNTDRSISDKVLSGSFQMDLLKPVSILNYEFAQAAAHRVGGVIFEFAPSMILYSLLYYPDFLTLTSFLRFLVVIFLAFIIYFLINFLIGLTAFVIQNNNSLQSLKIFIISLTAGAFIPLEFFPGWFNKFVNMTPFPYIFYWPIQIFLNRGDGASTISFIRIIGIDFLWILVLYGLSRFFLVLATRRFFAVGG